VNHEGKKDLEVHCLEDDWKNENFRWDQFTQGFADLIEKNTKVGIRDTVECNFSTTGIVEKAASQIALMSSC
jgi:hypothetical protein